MFRRGGKSARYELLFSLTPVFITKTLKSAAFDTWMGDEKIEVRRGPTAGNYAVADESFFRY